MKEIKIIRVRDVRLPQRSHAFDAGLDLFIPENISLEVEPNNNIVIPSGIIMLIGEGYMGLILNRSSIASKKGLLVGAQVIDSGYKGEIHFDLHNVSREKVLLTGGLKITQLIITQVSLPIIIEVKNTDLEYITPTKRDSKGFGSTDTQEVL